MGAERRKEEIIFFINLFFASWVGFPLFPEILYFITIILQRIRIIVGDAGFEPKTSAPEVWCATNVLLFPTCSMRRPDHVELISEEGVNINFHIQGEGGISFVM